MLYIRSQKGNFTNAIRLPRGCCLTQVRLTVIPNSKDVAPVRNQILEIDLANSVITGQVDSIAVGDGSAAGTYTTSTSYSTPSGY